VLFSNSSDGQQPTGDDVCCLLTSEISTNRDIWISLTLFINIYMTLANTMDNLHTAVVKQLNRQKVMQTPLGVDS